MFGDGGNVAVQDSEGNSLIDPDSKQCWIFNAELKPELVSDFNYDYIGKMVASAFNTRPQTRIRLESPEELCVLVGKVWEGLSYSILGMDDDLRTPFMRFVGLLAHTAHTLTEEQHGGRGGGGGNGDDDDHDDPWTKLRKRIIAWRSTEHAAIDFWHHLRAVTDKCCSQADINKGITSRLRLACLSQMP
jgi:hypothetical protein